MMNTCSQVVRLVQEMEQASAKFYDGLAASRPKERDMLESLSAQNRKLAAGVQRAYLSSISDAIEGCFAFQMEEDNYPIVDLVSERREDAVAQALEIERAMARFYSDAGDQSRSLLPDVSRALLMAGKAREGRIEALGALAASHSGGTHRP